MSRDIPLRHPRVGGVHSQADIERLAREEQQKEIARVASEDAAVAAAAESVKLADAPAPQPEPQPHEPDGE